MDRPGRATLVASLGAALVALSSAAAWAEPQYALREGYLCSQCHVNRTGGGKRTAFGTTYAQTVLPLWKGGPWSTEGATSGHAPGGWFIDPHLGDYVSLGAELRVQNLTTFAATGSYLGQTLTAPQANTFRIAEADLYVEITLVKNYLLLYLDETVAPDAASAREAFVLLQHLPLGAYLKAGRFLLPFGMRLPDDTIFVREVTGFNYANQDLGVEVGAEPGPAFLSIAFTNGAGGGVDNNSKKQIVGTAGVAVRHARVGFCYAWNNATTDTAGATRRVAGAFLGGGYGRLALLGEADVVRDWSGPGDGPTTPASPAPQNPTVRWQWALYGEADLLLYRGINLKLAYDFNQPDLDVAHNQRDRFTFALEAAVLPFLRLSAAYYWRRDIPQKVEGNQNILLFQLHGYM